MEKCEGGWKSVREDGEVCGLVPTKSDMDKACSEHVSMKYMY